MSGCGLDRTVCRHSNRQRRVIAQGEVKEFLVFFFPFRELSKADGIDKQAEVMRTGAESRSLPLHAQHLS